MRIINIVKSIAVSDRKISGQPKTGKTKYFFDHMQASFHIQSCASAFEFKIEPCVAFFDGTSYFALTKVSESCGGDITSLAPHRTHTAYLKYVETNDGGGSGMGTAEGYECIVAHKSETPSYGHYYRETITICVDDNHTVYRVEGPLQIEKHAPEYGAIKPAINEALGHASHRQSAEYRQAATLFAQKQKELQDARRELEEKERELKKQQADLDMQAAQLASDAMDYTQ